MSTTSAVAGWPATASPFHIAEQQIQQRVGVREKAEAFGRRSVRDVMPEQHRLFFESLPFFVLGGVDATGQPWASLRFGEPGFASTPDERTLRIAGETMPGDALADSWHSGALFGGLGIMPSTRRRNRVNGIVTSLAGDVLTVGVQQSFGNCPKHIQKRTPTAIQSGVAAHAKPSDDAAIVDGIDDDEGSANVLVADRLSAADRALLVTADTFFIASANTAESAGLARGVDVSHRGGIPGFIRIDDDFTLTTPDFSGNLFFNTLGNLLAEPRAGLMIIDYENGDVVQIAADAEILWQGADVEAFAGAERLVRFHLRSVRRLQQALPFHWSAVEAAGR